MTRRFNRTTVIVTGNGFLAGFIGLYVGMNAQSVTIGVVCTIVIYAVLLWLGFAHN